MKSIAVVLAACLGGAAHAQAPAPDAPDALRPQLAASVAPPAPSAVPPAEKTKDARRPTLVKVSGFVQGRYQYLVDRDDAPAAVSGTGATATTPDTFSIARARLRATGEVADGVGYAVEGDFATSSNLLRDGYARLSLLPFHEIRLGQQKTQFGYENPESDTRLVVVNRTIVSAALGQGNDSRDIGVGVLGKIPLGAGVGLEWAGTLVNGGGPNRGDDAVAPQKDLWGRVGPTLRLGAATVRLGASFARGHDVGTEGSGATATFYRYGFRRLGADVQLDTPWFFVAAEYVEGSDLVRGPDRERHGQYVYAYGKTPWHVGPIVRAEGYDPDERTGNDERERYTVGAYYDWLPVNARIVVNYELDRSATRRDDALLIQTQLVF